jgi:glycosyltransferase involved in cell wall biosynthesis
MPLVANLTVSESADDPRARRVLEAAATRGVETVSVSLGLRRRAVASFPARRALRSLGRLARTAATTTRLLRRARGTDPTIVHAHDLDTLAAGWLLARRNGARLVYDAHELYTGFDIDPPRLWLAAARRVEGALARRASAVITVSPEIAAELERRHRLATRPLVVLNCPSTAEAEVAEHETLRAIYQAAAGPGRFLDDLPEVEGLSIDARVLGAASAPAHVTLLPPVPPDQIVSSLAPYDIGLVIDRVETDNARFALPNKLFEYVMAGLAVVVPDAPAMARLVREEGIGRTYRPGQLGDVLAELAADRAEVSAMRRRARAAALARYNAEAQRPALYEAWGL